jgi:hypothetical protein
LFLLKISIAIGVAMIILGLWIWGVAFEKAEKGGSGVEDVVKVARCGSTIIASGIAWLIATAIVYCVAHLINHYA